MSKPKKVDGGNSSTPTAGSRNPFNYSTIMTDPVQYNMFKTFVGQNIDKFKEILKQTGNGRNVVSPQSGPQRVAQYTKRRRREMPEESSESESTSSELGENAESWGPKQPFEEILKGVIAYVDVTKSGENRSASIKLIAKCMGATVRDDFSADVTHVIYKEGSYKTFQRALLSDCRLVSILWLNACRKHSVRVPEDRYLVHRGRTREMQDTSALMSQIREDLKDLVKDEKRKSSSLGRTSKTCSSDSFQTPTGSPSESARAGGFVEVPSPDYTSDESNCGVVDGHSSSHLLEIHKKMHAALRDSLNEALDKSQMPTDIGMGPLKAFEIDKGTQKEKGKVNVLSDVVLPKIRLADVAELKKKNTLMLSDGRMVEEETEMTMLSLGLSDSQTKPSGGSLGNLGKNGNKETCTTMSSFQLSESQPEIPEGTRNQRTSKETCTTISSFRLSDSQTDLAKTTPLSNGLRKDYNKCGTDSDSTNISDSSAKSSKRKKPDDDETFSAADKPESLPITAAKRKRVLYDPKKSVHVALTPEEVERERARTQKSQTQKSQTEKSQTQTPGPSRKTKANETPERSKSSSTVSSDLNSTIDDDDHIAIVLPKSTFNKSPEKVLTERTQETQITDDKRRSTLEFQVPVTRAITVRKGRKPTMVCTKFHREEVLDFKRIVEKLGGFSTELVVTSRTTHLVVGEVKRTINLLKAIAQGCWILDRRWLSKSAKAQKWLNEEDYELTEFSPAVQQCRLERQAFGRTYRMDIFRDCGPMHVSKNSIPPKAELVQLIRLCRGKHTEVFRNVRIFVGEYFPREKNVICVSELWILDSIAANELKSFTNYFLKDPNPLSDDDSMCV